tara:strand:+ start:80 stop:364 length:285 start_codon:yes stop_codon:yes gene_type:complete
MDAEKILLEKSKKNVKDLFKSYLVLLEDLHQEHNVHFNKLRKNMPQALMPIIDQADYFDEDRLKYLRKKILDMGNEVIRDYDNNIEHFTISFKF